MEKKSFENTEQLDGHVSLLVDSYTNRSDKVNEATEEDMALAHLPTAEDPDDVIQNWIELDPEKIKSMSQKELIQMNSQLARKVALKKQNEKK